MYVNFGSCFVAASVYRLHEQFGEYSRVMHRIVFSSNKDICPLPLLFVSLSFLSPPPFFLIAFAKTLSTVLNRSGESRHPFLHPPWSTGRV